MNLEIRSEDAPLKIGSEFLKYEIRALLGHGDHAYVYEAFDPMLERTVAIKVIPDPPNSRRDLVQRSLEQGPILRGLNHRSLVSVYDVGTIGDELVYIVMERLVGHSLRELLKARHTLPVPEVLSIGIQVAEGIAWAHELQVLHRDLKPENIFITESQGVKVINTGITSFIVPSGMTTEWDCVRGTLLYMSPEHLQGFGVTARSDIFSLGALLYECLAGVPPALIGAEPPSLDELAWRQISIMPPLVNEVAPDVPDIVARLIQQMVAKEAVLRFETMDTVALSLREVYGRLVPNSEEGKRSESRPYVVFPSSALGMNASIPRDEPPPVQAVIAGAERLVSALSSDSNPGRVNSSDPAQNHGTAGAHWPRRWLLLAVVGVLLAAALGFLLLFTPADKQGTTTPVAAGSPTDRDISHSKTERMAGDAPPSRPVETRPAAAGSAAAAPAEESKREPASPSDAKNQNKTNVSASASSHANASEASPPEPVINGKTRSGAAPKAGQTPPNDLVF